MITALAVVAILSIQAAPTPAYWGDLVPGPHPIGFTQRWLVDSTRRLPAGDTYPLRYRPILLNIWYPAHSSRRAAMKYDDYFDGAIRAAARNPGLKAYATALIEYQRGVAWSELAGSRRDSTEPGLRQRLEEHFRAPSMVVRDAAAAPKSARVIVYTSGSGSSMDDNVVLCEYLASLGYTVVGSAFPEEDNSSFMTNVADHSRQRDIARILQDLARERGAGVPMHVTAIGHSAGAQAMLAFASDPTAPIDALLSLDTTQDYAMLSDRTWAYYTDELMANRRYVKLPLMLVADPTALFELADSLVKSPRVLLTVPGLSHNDFISQGIIRKRVNRGLAGSDTAQQATAEGNYHALLRYMVAWLRSLEPGEAALLPAAIAPLSATVVPVGERAPAMGNPIGTAREIRHLFGTATPAVFADQAIAVRAAHPEIADNQVFMMLLVNAVRRNQADQARSVFRELVARDSSLRQIPARLESRARLFQTIGAPELAAEWRRLGAQLVDSLSH